MQNITPDVEGKILNTKQVVDDIEASNVGDKSTDSKPKVSEDWNLDPIDDQSIQSTQPNHLNQIYSSATTFEKLGLSKNLLKGIYALGFQTPSDIQAKALPLLLSLPNKNMIAQSQAGTGKTACFSLNILTKIDFALLQPQALVLAPARELARQILDNIRELGKFTGVTTSLAVPGSISRGEKLSSHIIVGTPGTILDLIKKKLLSTQSIQVFVLDEADSMLDQQGLGDTSIRITNLLPSACQLLLFSATFSSDVLKFAKKVAPDAHLIEVAEKDLSVDSVSQFYMDCKNADHKAEVLCSIYGLLTIGQSIIFVRQRKTADDLHRKMTSEGHAVTSLHGNFDPVARDTAIDSFREGRSKVLITTNVLARGIDILQVNLVLNYDLPLTVDSRPDCETYIHRIGRTGRFGRRGVSINFCHDRQSFEEMKFIEAGLGLDIVRVPTDNLLEIEKILKAAL